MSMIESRSSYLGRIVVDTAKNTVYVERHPSTGQPARLTLGAMQKLEDRHVRGTPARKCCPSDDKLAVCHCRTEKAYLTIPPCEASMAKGADG